MKTGNVHLFVDLARLGLFFLSHVPCCTFLATATPHAWKLEMHVLLFHQNSRRGTAFGVQNICMRQLVLVFSLRAAPWRLWVPNLGKNTNKVIGLGITTVTLSFFASSNEYCFRFNRVDNTQIHVMKKNSQSFSAAKVEACSGNQVNFEAS